jgi:phenylacetate-CoA ligase
MRIRAERGETADSSEDATIAAKLEEDIRRNLLVRGKVELVGYGTLPRTERKSKRVLDERSNS